MKMTCGAAVAPILEHLGARCVFGIPGNHTLELYRGLAASGLRHITTRHEQGAGFMADGYARVSGEPGVAFLISGPGLLNAATPIAQAYADSVPMLVVSAVGAEDTRRERLGALHELTQQDEIAQGLCKSSITVTSAAELADIVTEAWAETRSGRPGPVHVQIPIDVQEHAWSGSLPALSEAAIGVPDVEALVEVLSNAQQPILLIGGGAVHAEGTAKLAEVLDAPTINTTNAKGVVPHSHALSVGGSPSLPCLQRALAEADVVLAVGTELGETDYALLPADGAGARWSGRVLRIDIDPDCAANRDADVLVVGDAGAAVRALLDKLTPASRGAEARAAQLREAVRRETHYHPDFGEFFAALQAAHEDLVVVGDSTRPTYYAAWMLEAERRRSYFHSASGFGTLGYALPAALGAACATARPVAALIGDGGLQFTLPELATGADAGLGVPVLVWCNAGYEEITNSLAARDVPTGSTVVSTPDLERLSQAYRLGYDAPGTLSELTDSVRTALTLNQPTLIRVDQSQFIRSPSGGWYV